MDPTASLTFYAGPLKVYMLACHNIRHSRRLHLLSHHTRSLAAPGLSRCGPDPVLRTKLLGSSMSGTNLNPLPADTHRHRIIFKDKTTHPPFTPLFTAHETAVATCQTDLWAFMIWLASLKGLFPCQSHKSQDKVIHVGQQPSRYSSTQYSISFSCP